VLFARLKHPASLPLHGCTGLDSKGGPVILTPLMTASVQSSIEAERREAPPPRWTHTQKHVVLLGIAVGMAFMHGHRCIHRDLKPAKVLLNDHCEPRIADFGISKFVERNASLLQSMYFGTVPFMAPEIHIGEAFDFNVDVYAFAMLMFAVLTGLEPFPNCNNFFIVTLKVIAGVRRAIPDSVSPPYARLMRQCWGRKPEERPTFAEIAFRLGEEACLEGLDLDVVKAYQARVCPPDLVPPTTIAFAQRAKQHAPVARAAVPIEELRRLADSGDGCSQVQFGKKLQDGDGIKKDDARALRY
jgi:serine/threonine protein kinase